MRQSRSQRVCRRACSVLCFVSVGVILVAALSIDSGNYGLRTQSDVAMPLAASALADATAAEMQQRSTGSAAWRPARRNIP